MFRLLYHYPDSRATTRTSRAISYEDRYSARAARASLAECLFEIGEHTQVKQVFSEIVAIEWGENKLELERIERIKTLLFQKQGATPTLL